MRQTSPAPWQPEVVFGVSRGLYAGVAGSGGCGAEGAVDGKGVIHMHRAKFLNNPSDRVVYFSPEEFQALEELVYKRIREPRQTTSAGHNVQTATEAALIEHAKNAIVSRIETLEAHVFNPMDFDGTSRPIIQRLTLLEDRLSALSTTVARNKKEWNESCKDFTELFDEVTERMDDSEKHKTTKKTEEFQVQIENLSYRIKDLEDTSQGQHGNPEHSHAVLYGRFQNAVKSVEEFAARVGVLENQMANLRSALHDAGKV